MAQDYYLAAAPNNAGPPSTPLSGGKRPDSQSLYDSAKKYGSDSGRSGHAKVLRLCIICVCVFRTFVEHRNTHHMWNTR
jgi:hypothetical protein